METLTEASPGKRNSLKAEQRGRPGNVLPRRALLYLYTACKIDYVQSFCCHSEDNKVITTANVSCGNQMVLKECNLPLGIPGPRDRGEGLE